MFYEILRKKRPLNLRPHNVHVFCLEKKVLADVTVLHGDARHHRVVELTIVGEVRLGGLDRGNHHSNICYYFLWQVLIFPDTFCV